MQSQTTWIAHLVSADNSEAIYPIPVEAEILLGRDASCQVVIDAAQYPTVSRFHAKIQSVPEVLGVWQLCDLKASNGTYLNGVRLQGCQILQTNDCIVLSKDGPQFIFRCEKIITSIPLTTSEPSADWMVEEHTVEESVSSSTEVAFNPDMTQLNAHQTSSHRSLWDVSLEKTQIFVGHTDVIRAVAFHAAGDCLASGSADKTIKIWDLNPELADPLLLTLTGHKLAISAVAFHPVHPLLVSGSADKTIKIWDLNKAEPVQTLSGHSMAVTSLAFSPDGKTLVSGSADKTIKIWDVATGTEQQTLAVHKMAVTALAFDTFGQLVASGSADKTLKLWKVSSGNEQANFSLRSTPLTFVWSPDHQTLAIGSEDKTIRLWNLKIGQEIRSLPGQPWQVSSIAIDRAGQQFASGSEDHTVRVWSF